MARHFVCILPCTADQSVPAGVLPGERVTASGETSAPHPRADFGRARRIRRGSDFLTANRFGRRHHAGPLVITVHRREDERDQNREHEKEAAAAPVRLGLAVGRRVGHAPKRNLIKRRLREAFRVRRAAMPPGIDIVVSVRPHDPLSVDAYGALLERAVRTLVR